MNEHISVICTGGLMSNGCLKCTLTCRQPRVDGQADLLYPMIDDRQPELARILIHPCTG